MVSAAAHVDRDQALGQRVPRPPQAPAFGVEVLPGPLDLRRQPRRALLTGGEQSAELLLAIGGRICSLLGHRDLFLGGADLARELSGLVLGLGDAVTQAVDVRRMGGGAGEHDQHEQGNCRDSPHATGEGSGDCEQTLTGRP